MLQALPPGLEHLGAGVPDPLGGELGEGPEAQLLGLLVERVES